ncbi:MAG TPA: anti-sigma factor [Planctomycetota bacterium]|nr:anti-sigma factor [Planctomycetota bacterium]
MKEYQEAATGLPRSLSPIAPSEGLKSRVMAAAAGRQAPRRAILSRVFWAAAAVVLLALLVTSLTDTSAKLLWTGAPGVDGTSRYDQGILKIDVSGLPALPAGKVYQLWHIGPQAAPVPCKTFTLNSSGVLDGEDMMKFAYARGHKFALTMEPIGGSKSPTTPIMAVAQ